MRRITVWIAILVIFQSLLVPPVHGGPSYLRHRRDDPDNSTNEVVNPNPSEHRQQQGRGLIKIIKFAVQQIMNLQKFLLPELTALEEKPANEDIKNLVKYHADNIIKRSNLESLIVEGMPPPEVQAVTFVSLTGKGDDKDIDIFVIKTLIAGKHYVHVKIGQARGEGLETTKVLGLVTDKAETDKLDISDLYSQK